MSAASKRFFSCIVIFISAAIIFLMLAGLFESANRARREAAYLSHAKAAAKEFDLPLAMVLAVIRTESDFKPDAVSSAGAVGLMQLMPETFRYITDERLGEHLPDDRITDPKTNIRYGAYYLSYLFAEFGDWRITLAAYNAGEGTVREWLAEDGMQSIPFEETKQYVTKALSFYEIYATKYKEMTK